MNGRIVPSKLQGRTRVVRSGKAPRSKSPLNAWGWFVRGLYVLIAVRLLAFTGKPMLVELYALVSYESATGVVTATKAHERTRGRWERPRNSYNLGDLTVRYSYTVGKDTLAGSTRLLSVARDLQGAKNLADRVYPVGAQVGIEFDPRAPERSRIPQAWISIMVFLTATFAGIFWAIYMILFVIEFPERPSPIELLSAPPGSRL